MTDSNVDSQVALAVERSPEPAPANPNEKLAVWRVVTQIDLSSGAYPISRIRWRRVHVPNGN